MLRFPPKRILVGVDLSEPSLSAWRHAVLWGKRFGAKLKAVYTRGPEPLDIPGIPRVPGGPAALARDVEEEFCRVTGAPELLVAEGDPAVVLLRLARTWKADLLVVGTHGRRGLPRLLLGSVAESLMQEATLPVLAVHEDPRPIRSVLAPMNFTSYADAVFQYAAALVGEFEARLVAHHVASAEETFTQARCRLEDAIARLPGRPRGGCSPQIVLSRGSVPEEIARASWLHDLIVLSNHRKGSLQAMLLGTTAQRVLRAARVPLLSVPEPVGRRPAPTAQGAACGEQGRGGRRPA